MSVLSRPTSSGRAVVLRVWPTGETSVVASVLTGDDGLVKLIAKGARETRSRLRPLVQPGRLVDLEYSLDPARDLQYLRGGSLVRDPLAVASRLEISAYLLAALEIVDRCRPPGGPEAELFALCHDYVQVLSCADAGREVALFYAFEIALLELHGLRPRLAACTQCGTAYAQVGSGALWMSPSAGGLVCASCVDRGVVAGARPLSSRTLAVWDVLGRAPASWPDLELPRTVARDWGVMLHRFLEYHLPGYQLPAALDLLKVRRDAGTRRSTTKGSS